MAVDSERKRKSIVAIGFMVIGPVVVADGSFDEGDRQTIGYSYASQSTPIVPAGFIKVQSAYISIPKATTTIGVPYSTGSITT